MDLGKAVELGNKSARNLTRLVMTAARHMLSTFGFDGRGFPDSGEKIELCRAAN